MLSRDVQQLHITEIFWKMNCCCNYRMCLLQHDGAPLQFSKMEFPNEDYEGRWTERGGPVDWPAQSPDLKPIRFLSVGLYGVKSVSRW
jgi:hypothetical protein